jgi:predicted Holliday junction resolvase-like endonuclease
MIEMLFGVLLTLFGILCWKVYDLYKIGQRLKLQLEEANQGYLKLLSQKKSSEVLTGQIAEKLAPFLEGFPGTPEDLVFSGQPIDYIWYGQDEVRFIEVKSGRARLSSKQKHIKELIQAGKVSFHEYRIR